MKSLQKNLGRTKRFERIMNRASWIAVFYLVDDAQAIILLKRITEAMTDINAAIADVILPITQANITETLN